MINSLSFNPKFQNSKINLHHVVYSKIVNNFKRLMLFNRCKITRIIKVINKLIYKNPSNNRRRTIKVNLEIRKK
jgi:hypothetical protein